MSINPPRRRPLSVGPLRAFEAVARLKSFRAAADELFLTQSAVSRQIQALEEEVGAQLLSRGTRHVALTGAGIALLQAAAPALARIDSTVRQIRAAGGRRIVNVTTFASFASLWLIPRLASFEALHPDIDIRLLATDRLEALDGQQVDLALRYGLTADRPPQAHRLFDEVITPATSPQLAERARSGELPPLRSAADLVHHTLLEEDDVRPSARYLSWRHWLAQFGEPELEPRRWLYLNFTHQQIQAAIDGQGVALARIALICHLLERGELVEPFGPAGRLLSPCAYWMQVAEAAKARPEVQVFVQWVAEQAERTGVTIGASRPDTSSGGGDASSLGYIENAAAAAMPQRA